MATMTLTVPSTTTGNNIMSLTTSGLMTAFTTLTTSPPSSSYPPSQGGAPPGGQESGECRLLGPFSLLVQAALGTLALLSLVWKRWRERPQRPVKVWAFDVSKQVFGSGMLHLANLLMSMFSAGQIEITSEYRPNPCSYYLLNLGIDTTLGIPILILILRVLNAIAFYTPLANPPQSIESGNYGHPPSALWWFKQSMIYFVGLLSMKICVFFLIQLLPFIVKVGDWALQWTEGNAAVQIFFVMLLFPVIMNAIQYYIIDTFIKKPLSDPHDALAEDDDDALEDDDYHHRDALLAGMEDDDTLAWEEESDGKGDEGSLEDDEQTKPTIDLPMESEHTNPASISGSSSTTRGESKPGSKPPSTKSTGKHEDS